MKKAKPYVLRITGGIVLLIILFWITIYTLVNSKKDFISALAISEINKQVNGEVIIGDLAPDFFRSFPGIAVQLSDVFIRDSLWSQHHHNLIEAKKIYIQFQLLSLFSGKPVICKVIVNDASIYLFTDECGYHNLNRNEDLTFHNEQRHIPDMAFYNTRLTVENQGLHTLHDIEAHHLTCHMTEKDSTLILNVTMKLLVHGIAFNDEKGSYLEEKNVNGTFRLTYQPNNNIAWDNVRLTIARQPFKSSGHISFRQDPNTYEISIQTKNIHYSKATGLLTASLREKLDSINILQPIDASANIAGLMAPGVVPRILTQFSVKNAAMETPAGPLEHCSYTGDFINQVDSCQLPGDENSRFTFYNFNGSWSAIPLTSSQIEISNLKAPYVTCDVKSVFALDKLNTLTESSSIRFLKGTGNLDVYFEGLMTHSDTIHPLINGTFSLMDAEVKYLPRNLLFENCCGELEFTNEDLIIKEITSNVGHTDLSMSGNILNMLALLDKNPEQLTIEWNVATDDLRLNDFISYIGEKEKVPAKTSSRKNKIIRITENMDKLLSDGTAKLNLTADKMTYKKFVASHVEASLLLEDNKVILNDVRANHAGGSLGFKGTMINGNRSNFLHMECTVKNVDIPAIFYAFDNFGQDAITSKNMKGNLTAKIKLESVLTDNARLLENSTKGKVDFNVKNGELINFEPAIQIASTAFKNRDFSHIQFADLTNTLALDGSAIAIDKMEIRSNVVTLFVEGIYDTKKGTDMSIQVPLSNISENENEVLENTGRVGMNIRLRAKTGDDGKLKVSWDPFNNASKKRKREQN